MSSFGTIFRVTTYGESHCRSVGCIVENCPPGTQALLIRVDRPGMLLTEDDIQVQLSRRRPGQSALTTPVTPPCPIYCLSCRSAVKKTECRSSQGQSSTQHSAHPSACSSKTSTNVPTTTPKWTSTHDPATRIGLTCKSTA